MQLPRLHQKRKNAGNNMLPTPNTSYAFQPDYLTVNRFVQTGLQRKLRTRRPGTVVASAVAVEVLK